MATEVNVRICGDPSPERTPLRALSILVEVVEQHLEQPLTLNGFRVRSPGVLRPVHRDRAQFGREDLVASLTAWDTPELALGTTATIVRRGSDRTTGATTDLTVTLRFDSLGGRCWGRTGDWLVDGDLVVSAVPANAYRLPTTLDGVAVERPAVLENLTHAGAILAAVIGELRPHSVKVGTDAGEPFPFNANGAYYASPHELLKDAELLGNLFRQGHQVLDLPPLGTVSGDLSDVVFHAWRDRAEARRVQDALAVAVRSGHQPTEAAVVRLLDSGRFPVRTLAGGFAVAGGPFPLNAFLDEFYLALLTGGRQPG